MSFPAGSLSFLVGSRRSFAPHRLCRRSMKILINHFSYYFHHLHRPVSHHRQHHPCLNRDSALLRLIFESPLGPQRPPISRLQPRSAFDFKLHHPANTDIFSTLVHHLLTSVTTLPLSSFQFEPPSQPLPQFQLPHRLPLEVLPLCEGESLRQSQRPIGAESRKPP